MQKKPPFAVLALGIGLMVAAASAEARPIEVDQGWWRLEVQGAGAIHSRKTDREGDWYLTGNVEYEMPTAVQHLTLGLRGYPLFFYETEDRTIYGVAAGFTLRLYLDAEAKEGLYAEAGSSALWHSHHFEGNSMRVNFLNELGFGYKFRSSPWNVSVKYQHTSNASTGNDNAGINAFSVGLGYRF